MLTHHDRQRPLCWSEGSYQIVLKLVDHISPTEEPNL